MTLVQVPCVEGNREHNFGNARLLLEQYKPGGGIQFIQFPELFAIGFRHEDYPKEGPGVPGPTSDFLSSVAEDYGSYVIGTGIEKSDGKFYNTLVLAKPDGKISILPTKSFSKFCLSESVTSTFICFDSIAFQNSLVYVYPLAAPNL